MATKNTYQLTNPYIEGSVNVVVRASNPFNGGKKLYNNVSKFFTNHVDDFYMTIQNAETKNLTHFQINEKKGSNGSVDFNLVKLDNNFGPELEKKLITSVTKLSKQTGGKYKSDDSSDSTSSDESDYYKIPAQPITRLVYYYLPYYELIGLSPIDASRLFLPMFSLPINPSLEIRFDLYRYM